MNKNLEKLLEDNKGELEKIATKHNIQSLSLFGSQAKGNETKESDIDLIVKFDFTKINIGLFELHHIQKEFEKALGKDVDLVTKPNQFIAPYINQDLITIYERR